MLRIVRLFKFTFEIFAAKWSFFQLKCFFMLLYSSYRFYHELWKKYTATFSLQNENHFLHFQGGLVFAYGRGECERMHHQNYHGNRFICLKLGSNWEKLQPAFCFPFYQCLEKRAGADHTHAAIKVLKGTSRWVQYLDVKTIQDLSKNCYIFVCFKLTKNDPWQMPHYEKHFQKLFFEQ